MEALVFEPTDEKTDKGWPKFKAINHGAKTIRFASLWGYAYDKDGKQIYRTKGNLSWSSTMPSCEPSHFDVAIVSSAMDLYHDDDAPAAAVHFEIATMPSSTKAPTTWWKTRVAAPPSAPWEALQRRPQGRPRPQPRPLLPPRRVGKRSAESERTLRVWRRATAVDGARRGWAGCALAESVVDPSGFGTRFRVGGAAVSAGRRRHVGRVAQLRAF